MTENSATSEPVPWKANQTSGRWIVPPPDPDAIERALREAKRHEPPATYEAVEATEPMDLDAALRLMESKTHHYDCEDCWYSCATLTCDDERRSDKCDCGADKAVEALAVIRAALGITEGPRDA